MLASGDKMFRLLCWAAKLGIHISNQERDGKFLSGVRRGIFMTSVAESAPFMAKAFGSALTSASHLTADAGWSHDEEASEANAEHA